MNTKKKTDLQSRTHRRFEPAFKHDAVKLGRQLGIAKAAGDLGISESNLRGWTKEVEIHGSLAFAPREQRDDVMAENRRLREENRVLKLEREILKKATVFFAKDLS